MTTTRNIDGVDFTFECYVYETRNAWGHECTLFKNGLCVNKNKVRYYNRTWESYQFQTVMKCCVDEIIDSIYAGDKDKYKQAHNLKRMTKKAKEDFEGNPSKEYQMYKKLLQTL